MRKKTYKIISLIENSLHLHLRDILPGMFWTSGATAIQAVMVLGLAVFFANYLSQADYGLYKYVLTILSLLAFFSLPGLKIATTHSVVQGHYGTVWSQFKISSKWSLLATSLSCGLGIYYLYRGNDILGWSFLLASLPLVFYNSTTIYTSYWEGRKKFFIASSLSTARLALGSLATMVAIICGASIPVLILVLLTTETLIRSVFLYATLRKIPRESATDPLSTSYGIQMTILKGIGTASSAFEQILIFQMVGAVGIAIFNFAVAPIEQARSFQSSLTTVTFSKFANNSWTIPTFAVLMKKSFRPLCLSLLLSLCYILVAPFLFKLLFPTYMNAVFYSQLFALSMPATIMSTILGNIFQAKKMTTVLYSRLLYSVITTFTFIPAMIIGYGLTGFFVAILIRKYFTMVTDIAQLYGYLTLPLPRRWLKAEVDPS